MPRVRALVVPVTLAAGVAAAGCPKQGQVARSVAPAPSYEPAGETKCAVAKSHSEPLIVEWPSGARAKLEAVSRKGLVAVRYRGCEIEVLPRCKVPGTYGWTPLTRKEDRVHMRDADELWANVPLGAAKLEGKLARAGELHVRMTIVGRWESDRDLVRVDELAGECANATHVIVAMAAGAFDFWAGVDAQVSGAASAFGAGAGGASASKSELLERDGDTTACVKASSGDKTPPDGCGALLRLELATLGAPAPKTPTCSEKTAWDGKQCAALVVASGAECPAGFVWEGDKCQAPKTVAPVASASAGAVESGGAAAPKKASTTPGCSYGDGVDCTKRCEVDLDAASCNDLGLMLSRGDGLAVDEAKATTYFLRACDLGSAIGCNNAGMRLEYGRGAPKDEATAANLYEKACDAGWAGACNNHARMLANGWGVPQDEPRAVDLFRKGCGMGDAGACANLGWFHVRGRGVAPDRTAGVGWLRKACTAGNGWACDRLRDLKETP